MFRGVARLSKAFRNLLKHIDKLSHIEKERVFPWVKRYVEPSSSVGTSVVVKHLLIQRIPFFTVLEKVTNGLHLLIVAVTKALNTI